MIPESRKDDGLILRRPVRENVSLTSLGGSSGWASCGAGPRARGPRGARTGGRHRPRSRRRRRRCRAATSRSCSSRARSSIEPAVLLADEPTRGIDVGAKRDIYEVLVRLAGDGMAILLISNEVEEILGLAHRVLVMRAGRLVAELEGPEMTEEAIVGAAFGTATTTAA